MARQRRGAWSPPELRGTLGTLLRTTLAQAGSLRDALERGAREGRSRVEDALAGRRRSEALGELGEIVLDLIRRGEIDLKEIPEVRDVVARLDELDEGAVHDRDERDDEEDDDRLPPSRSRFDTRPSPGGRRGDRDGTVSAKAWSPPSSKSPARVWRPPVDIELESIPDDEDDPAPPAPHKPSPIPRRGGIRFDSDSDLADYMHPDDVPPKKPTP